MKRLLLIILVTVTAATSKAQMLAVETDALLDGMMTPNLGFEMVTGDRSTLGLHAFFNSKPWGQEVKMVGIQPEWRYFLSGRPMHSHFVGIGAIGANYDITWKGKVYDGNAIGAGITFGYVWNITKRLNLDFHSSLGMVFYKQKEYYVGDDYEDYSIGGEVKSNADGYYLIPVRIGVSLSYILK